jgi:NAD(P)-dependent dehydrogenase (short-subunit alcohol dehydrogenase family)
MSPLFSLSGKTAVVTGGGSGIGQAIANALAEAGAGVLVADVITERVDETVAAICTSGFRAEGMTVDVRSRASVEAITTHALKVFGQLDIQVNAAGIGGRVLPFTEMTDDDWHEVLDTDLTSLFLCGQAAARTMMKAGGGSIINITSQLADVAQLHCVPYLAAKGGAKMLTKGMAIDLAPYRIRVNAIAPGLTRTRMTNLDGDAWRETRKDILRHIPVGRPAEAAEIAGAALYLASDASSYVTGTTILVDGGYTAV